MAKVDIDTDKFNNELLPLAFQAWNQINLAMQYGGDVNFPNDEYSWSWNIQDRIRDCNDLAAKYKDWAAGVKDKFINNITNGLDDISSITVDEIVSNEDV